MDELRIGGVHMNDSRRHKIRDRSTRISGRRDGLDSLLLRMSVYQLDKVIAAVKAALTTGE